MSQHRSSEASGRQQVRQMPPIEHCTPSPLPSALKKKDRPKVEKNVTWSPEVIDNEKLKGQKSYVPRLPSPSIKPTSSPVIHAANTMTSANSPAAASAPKLASIVTPQNPGLLSNKSSATPRPSNPQAIGQNSAARLREHGLVLNKISTTPGPSSRKLPQQTSGYVPQARQRSNTFSSGTGSLVFAAQPSASVEPQQNKKPQKQQPLPNMGKKRDAENWEVVVIVESRTIQRPHKRPSSVPPPVPELPTQPRYVPPPTPRISRLPSPDLPDIDGKVFCACDPPCTSEYYHKGGLVNSKMDQQLKAAKDHMKKSKDHAK